MCNHITKEYLRAHPKEVFVFGDNLLSKGYGGAAALRDEPNTYGFVTKRQPNNNPDSFYTVQEYNAVYVDEIAGLIKEIEEFPNFTYLISRLGAGLANKYLIFEKIIQPQIKNDLKQYKNVKFLW